MEWEGEVVAIKDDMWPSLMCAVTLAAVNGSRGVVELTVPRRQIAAYPVGRRVAVRAGPRRRPDGDATREYVHA